MPPINTRLRTDVEKIADRPEPSPVQARGGPSLPSAAPILNTVLRCPLPNIVPASPDNLRQYYVGGFVPQYRFSPPLPLSSNSSTPVSTEPSTQIIGKLVTSANPTDTISLVGVSTSSAISVTPTNSVAAAMTGVYVSGKSRNKVTISHPSTAGGTFDIIVTNS